MTALESVSGVMLSRLLRLMRPVGMAEVALRRNLVAHQLLQLFDIWEAPLLGARPDRRRVDVHRENAAGAWHQRHLAKLGLKSRQKLLGVPGRAQQPAALRAIVNLDSWLVDHNGIFLCSQFDIHRTYA